MLLGSAALVAQVSVTSQRIIFPSPPPEISIVPFSPKARPQIDPPCSERCGSRQLARRDIPEHQPAPRLVAASDWLSGLKTSVRSWFVAPSKVLSTVQPALIFHKIALRSSPPEAAQAPSGLNRHAPDSIAFIMLSECMAYFAAGRVNDLNRAIPYPAMIVLPSGLKATLSTSLFGLEIVPAPHMSWYSRFSASDPRGQRPVMSDLG